MSLSALKEKMSGAKGILKFTATATAITLVAGASSVFLMGSAEAEEVGVNQYKEEIVEKGSIVVGVTEMGSVSMRDTAVSVNFDTEINELFVKAGQYVNEGDLLATIDISSYTDSYNDALLSLEEAQLSLEKIQLTAESDRLAAEKAYAEAVLAGNTAEEVYQLNMSSIDTDYQQILDDIEALEEDIADLEDEIDDGAGDSDEAEEARDEIDDIEAEIEDVQEKIDHATTCAGVASGSCEHPEWEHDLSVLNAEMVALEYELEKAKEELTKVYDDYDDKEETLEDDLDKLIDDIAAKYIEKDNYEANIELEKLTYDAELENTVYEHEIAQSVYDNTINQINNTLKSEQQKVSELQEELAEISEMGAEGQIFAPTDGYVMTHSEVGTELNANTSIVTLAEKYTVDILVSIPQEDISDISLGMEVNILFDAYEEYLIPAVVDSISIVPSGGMTSSINYTVTIVCDISDYEDVIIYQGMTSDATFIQKQEEDVLLVSNKCIINENGEQFVQMYDETGAVIKVAVETGFSDGFEVEILSGLNEGDVVLIESAVNQSAN